MRLIRGMILPLLGTILLGPALPGHAAQMMTRTLKAKPAIVIAAFGTSTRAKVTYDAFSAQLREAFPEHEIRWAFTSEVIRQIVNDRRRTAGNGDLLQSLSQVLADLQADGYTKVAVQPLHVFPGEEYAEVLGVVKDFPGLRVEAGETLLQRWDGVHRVLQALSADFLSPDEGCNVLVAHGTPSTDVGSNLTLLGMDRLVSRRYPNVFLGTVEGIFTRQEVLAPAKACAGNQVRFLPLMFVAGDHIMNDIMGEAANGEAPSWRQEMLAAGKVPDVPTVTRGDEVYYRGLGFLPAVNEIFIREIHRALDRL